MTAQVIPSLFYRYRAIADSARRAEEAHRRGKSPNPILGKRDRGRARGGARGDRPAFQDHNPVGGRQHVLELVLDEQNRDAQFLIYLYKERKEPLARRRVKPRHRFVQKQKPRAHRDHGSQAQKLRLAARKFGGFSEKPVVDAEKIRRFPDATADQIIGKAEIFQPEGKLAPNMVANDLVFRVLKDVADFPGRHSSVNFAIRYPGV